MKKLLAVGILAAIPIGIVVLVVGLGGWLGLLSFIGTLIAVGVVVTAALWAATVLFG